MGKTKGNGWILFAIGEKCPTLDPMFPDGWPDELKNRPIDLSVADSDNGTKKYKTKDEDWINKAEEEGLIQRLTKVKVLGIQEFIIYESVVKSDPSVCHITIKSKEGKVDTIVMEEKDILSIKAFERKYILKFQERCPLESADEYKLAILHAIKTAKRRIQNIDDDPIITDVANLYNKSETVNKKEELLIKGSNCKWHDQATNTVYIQSSDLKNIAKEYDVKLDRLAALLGKYLKGSSKQISIEGKYYRVWAFRPDAFKSEGLE